MYTSSHNLIPLSMFFPPTRITFQLVQRTVPSKNQLRLRVWNARASSRCFNSGLLFLSCAGPSDSSIASVQRFWKNFQLFWRCTTAPAQPLPSKQIPQHDLLVILLPSPNNPYSTFSVTPFDYAVILYTQPVDPIFVYGNIDDILFIIQ
jgi:hypothetical protein